MNIQMVFTLYSTVFFSNKVCGFDLIPILECFSYLLGYKFLALCLKRKSYFLYLAIKNIFI